MDLEEFLEIYGFPRVPGVWPGLRRISRNLRFSACARSLAWTWKNFSKFTVFSCARSLARTWKNFGKGIYRDLHHCRVLEDRAAARCQIQHFATTRSNNPALEIPSPHIGFDQSGLTMILSLRNVHSSCIYRVIDTLPVFKLASRAPGVWLGT